MTKKKLFILDVGHGNCTVLRDTEGTVVIDAGAGATLLEFLKTEGIKKVEVILLSHADADHIGGLIAILNSGEFELGIIRFNPDGTKHSKLFKELNNNLSDYEAQQNDLRFSLDDYKESIIRKELEFDWEPILTSKHTKKFNQGDVDIEILAPNNFIAAQSAGNKDNKGRTLNSNSNSVVIRLVLDEKPIALIPGDIDLVGFENLLENKVNCEAPIVVFPHHGGKPGKGNLKFFVDKFCEETKPEIVIFSIGREKFNNPNPKLVELIREKIPNVRIMCTQLSKHCSTNLSDIEKPHLNDKFAKGKNSNSCCAGTIEIDLDSNERFISPGFDSHKNFIRISIPESLCTNKLVSINL